MEPLTFHLKASNDNERDISNLKTDTLQAEITSAVEIAPEWLFGMHLSRYSTGCKVLLYCIGQQ